MKSVSIAIGAVVVVGALVIGALALGGKSDNMKMSNASPSMSNAAPASAAADMVAIKGYAFVPATTTVKIGTTVTWTNYDIAKHNIVVDEGQPAGGPDGPLFGKGETYQFTFTQAGTYVYHCSPHPYMHGKVVVTQ